jgi:hypothetical protein
MAWRIHEQVVRAVIDNRVRGLVTGEVWLAGRTEPLRLLLEGNGWNDLAGCLLTITHPDPKPDPLDGLAFEQCGVCGDMTASRKVKIPTVDISAWLEERPGIPFPFRLANSVYLEWFSERNGRVVIEAHDFEVSLSTPLWRLTAADDARQHRRNAEALEEFMRRLGSAAAPAPTPDQDPDDPPDQLEAPAEPDPDLAQVMDQLTRIEQLKSQVAELAGGPMLCGGNLPLDEEEKFLQRILACETAPEMTGLEMLALDGFQPPRPEELSEAELTRHLWSMIDALARRSIYLDHTDHLSDRELYTILLDRVLIERSQVFPIGSGWNTQVMLDEYGGPEGEVGPEAYLRFYADPETRRRWTAEFPDIRIPPHEEPCYDRDRQLPAP